MPYDDEVPPGAVEPSPELDRLAYAVIGAAIEVHRHLGPGLPEEAYQQAMQLELSARRIPFEAQKIVTVFYKGTRVAQMKLDVVVGGTLVVELKAVEQLEPVHRLQAKTYMGLIHQPLSLLINFNVPVLKEGIRCVVQTS